MAVFEINLIRDQVMPAQRRAAFFWLLAAYLAACGVLLAYGANTATRRLVAAAHARAEVAVLCTHNGVGAPGQGDAMSQWQTFRRQITEGAAMLENVDAVLKSRIRLPSILRGLVIPLPSGVYIVSLDLDGTKRDLTFDVVVPARGAGPEVNAEQLVALWNADTGLMSRLARIQSVFSERHKLDERPVFVMRFATTVAAGGS